MGEESRRRREARRLQHGTRTRQTAVGSAHTVTPADLLDLISVASGYASVSPRAAASRISLLIELSATAESAQLDPAVLVVDEVLARLGLAWEHGWQPLDLVHAARRRTSPAAAAWTAQAVGVEGERAGAADRAPDAWIAQLNVLASRHPRRGPAALIGAGATVQQWTVALVALDFLQDLPRTQQLMQPPSRWGTTRRVARPSATRGEAHAKTLTRIRALLAKAESTDFAAEAEAFTAKAQDLMTRHAIDEALVADEAGESVDVDGIRVLIDHPYALEKAGLLHVIAQANRTRAVWNDFASCVTLVGVPTDVEQVEMLFTSTLVQATRAMTQAGQAARPSAGERSSGFRKAFLMGYSHRIGERLEASTHEATATYGTDLVPVLQRQSEAVDGEFERLFPHVTTGSRRTRVDLRGFDAGTRAADDAVLPAASIES